MISSTLPFIASLLSIHIPISRPIRRTFSPEECDLNSTCVLFAKGKHYFQAYKYPYIYYTASLSWYDFNGSDNDFLGFCDE
jgi:hypothetical protein